MHRSWMSLVAVLLISCGGGGGGGVSQADFDAWKASVQKSGNDVDAWIKDAHNVVKWVADNAATFCPSCDPPTPPPSPPPDGGW